MPLPPAPQFMVRILASFEFVLSLEIKCHFSLIAFKIFFSASLAFGIFTGLCLVLDLGWGRLFSKEFARLLTSVGFCLWGKFGKFFRHTCSVCDTDDRNVRSFMMVPQVPEVLFLFFVLFLSVQIR